MIFKVALTGETAKNVHPIIIDLVFIGFILLEFSLSAYIIDLIVRSI